MVDILQNSAAADDDVTAPADVLTLHRDVAARWTAAGRMGAQAQAGALSAIEGHHNWIKGLSGLGALGGSFGPQAWNLATQIAVSPEMLARVTTQTRSLQVGELADLVQIVLEELELDGAGGEFDAEIAGLEQQVRQLQPKAAQGASRTNRAPSRQSAKAGAAAKGRPATARAAAPRAALGKQAQLRDLRRLIQQIRAASGAAEGLAVGTASQAVEGIGRDGVQQPHLPTPSGRPVPAEQGAGQFGPGATGGPGIEAAAMATQGGTANLAQVAVRALSQVSGARAAQAWSGAAAGRRPTFASLSARPAHLEGDAAAHPLWTLGEFSVAARAPRALRWAEASADRALLEPPALQEFGGELEPAQRSTFAASVQGSRTSLSPASRDSVVASQRAAAVAQGQAGSAHNPRASMAQAHRRAIEIWRANQAQSVAGAVAAQHGSASAAAVSGGNAVASSQSRRAGGARPAASAQMRSAGAAETRPMAVPAVGPAALPALRAAADRARDIVARAEAAAQFTASAESATLAHWQTYFAAADAVQSQTGMAGRPSRLSARGLTPSLAVSGQPAGAASAIAASADLTGRAARRGTQTIPGRLAAAAQPRFEAAPGDLLSLHDDLADAAEAAGGASAASDLRQPARLAAVPGGTRAQGRPAAGLSPWWTEIGAAKGTVPRSGPGRASVAAAASAGAAGRAVAAHSAVAPVRAGVSAGQPAGAAQFVQGAAFARGQLPGLAGLAAVGLGQRVDARASMGLAPTGQKSLPAAALSLPTVLASAAGQDAIAAYFAAAGSGSRAAPSAIRAAFAPSAGRALQPDSPRVGATANSGARAAALAAQVAGTVGEWLDLGADFGAGALDAVTEQAVGTAATRRVAGTAASARSLAASAALQAVEARAPAAIAAQAAVAAVLRARSQSRTAVAAGGGAAAAQNVAAMAGLREIGVLAARPAGRTDSLTAWVAQAAEAAQSGGGGARAMSRSAPTARLRAMRTEQAGAGEWLDLAATEMGDTAGAEATPATARGRGDTASATGAAQPRATAQRATPAALGADTPQALKAMLKAWGETPAKVPAEAAAAYVARFLGRSDVAREVARRLADGATARGELVAPASSDAFAPEQATAVQTRRPAQARLAKPALAAQAVQASAQGDEIVLSGMAALAALTGGGLFGPPKPRERGLATADSPRELLAPGVDSSPVAGDEAVAGAARSSPVAAKAAAAKPAAATARATAGVQMHTFAPVSLRRGHNMVGQARRARWLHATPRGTFATRLSSARSAARSGYAGGGFSYGGAGAGVNELVGLTGGDGGWYLGETAPAPSAVRGADRLSAAVAARRSASIGRSPGRTAQSASAAPALLDGMAVPTDFRMGQDLVNPAAGIDAMVEAANRSSGATASHKGTQAAAMTRVLSVTAAPTANMLPLVAPAAQAIVAAAAAKPLSEGIATSGGDPTYGTPIVGVGDHKAGKASQGAGGDGARQQAEDQASNVQDIEALAVKVARSVMVRIKRERERRGLHV